MARDSMLVRSVPRAEYEDLDGREGHRLQHAKELLARTPMSITEVALAAGFTNPTHFAVRYSKAFGLSPSAERNARYQQ
jgi:transcriptional regulator GlxA family with amidase domain